MVNEIFLHKKKCYVWVGGGLSDHDEDRICVISLWQFFTNVCYKFLIENQEEQKIISIATS